VYSTVNDAEPVISAHGLRKRYGDVEAVRGVDLDVRRGEVFAFLGPNGAGKTTTVEILEGFRAPSSGEVRVLGRDPATLRGADRARIGCVLQSGDLERRLTPRETLTLWASYFPRPLAVDDVLERIGLADGAGTWVERLSGGQRRRLEVGLAVIGDPELLFLDEPTTGFDPQARRGAWELIGGLRDLGATVFLTTHYLEEAQRLADRVAIIRDGRVVATGSPAKLAAQRAPVVRFALPDGLDARDLPPGVQALAGTDGRRSFALTTAQPTALLAELCGWAAGRGIELEGLAVQPASLEDIYLELTTEEASPA